MPWAQNRLKSSGGTSVILHDGSTSQQATGVASSPASPEKNPQTSLQPSGSCSNTKGPWCTFLRDNFFSNKIYFPQNEAGYFSLLENDCCVRDESSWLLSDRCQSFICPCSHEVEEGAKAVICLFQKRKRLPEPHFPQSQGLLGVIIPRRLGEHLGPSCPNSKQFSSLIYFYSVLHVQISAHGTEGRKGKLRSDRAAGTLNGLKDALEC